MWRKKQLFKLFVLLFDTPPPLPPKVPQMLSMMVDLEEDEEWAMADELEDDDFDR